MVDLKVTDVRVLPGDSGFLIDDGKTAVLFDTSFAFTGDQMADKVKTLLGERKLDYIFLSHSHYDHVLGTPYILKLYPEAAVVAGEYAAKIFGKPTARATMRDLDRKYAATCGVTEYEDLIDELK
ncbi:MAG: MBL fold metallo-hydrolase, partial [Lachnospiraceae bacterium]